MRIPMKVDYGVRALVDLAEQADVRRPRPHRGHRWTPGHT